MTAPPNITGFDKVILFTLLWIYCIYIYKYTYHKYQTTKNMHSKQFYFQTYQKPFGTLSETIWNIIRNHLKHYQKPFETLSETIWNIRNHLEHYQKPFETLSETIWNIIRNHLKHYQKPFETSETIWNIIRNHLDCFCCLSKGPIELFLVPASAPRLV